MTNYDFIGTMHTVVPSDEPITATITPTADRWCTGGQAEADVTLANAGPATEHLQSARLVLHGGAAKWALHDWPPLDIAPGGSITLHAAFTVPAVNPGTYGLIVYGYDGEATVAVDGPTVCAASDLTAVGTPVGSVMSNVRTNITFTNVGNHPCLLADPTVIDGLDPSNNPTQLSFRKGTYFGDPPPLASHVLPVAGQAMLNVGTGTGCLDGTRPPVPWSGLRLSFTLPSFETTTIDVAVDIDTACGFSISAYGRPEPG